MISAAELQELISEYYDLAEEGEEYLPFATEIRRIINEFAAIANIPIAVDATQEQKNHIIEQTLNYIRPSITLVMQRKMQDEMQEFINDANSSRNDGVESTAQELSWVHDEAARNQRIAHLTTVHQQEYEVLCRDIAEDHFNSAPPSRDVRLRQRILSRLHNRQ